MTQSIRILTHSHIREVIETSIYESVFLVWRHRQIIEQIRNQSQITMLYFEIMAFSSFSVSLVENIAFESKKVLKAQINILRYICFIIGSIISPIFCTILIHNRIITSLSNTFTIAKCTICNIECLLNMLNLNWVYCAVPNEILESQVCFKLEIHSESHCDGRINHAFVASIHLYIKLGGIWRNIPKNNASICIKLY